MHLAPSPVKPAFPEVAATGIGRLLRRYASDLAVEDAYLALVRPNELSQCIDAQGNQEPLPVELGPFVTRIVDRSGILLIDDLRTDSVVLETVDSNLRGALLGLGATDAFGELVGVLLAHGHAPRSWTNANIERGGDIAGALASFLTVDQERRHAQRRVRSEVRARELRLQMHTIANQAASAATIAELAKVLVNETPELLGCDWSVIASRSPETDWQLHLPDRLGEQLAKLFEADDAPGRLLLHGAERLGVGRHSYSPANREDFSLLQAAFPDRHTARISAVPLSDKSGLSVVMLSGFATEELSARTDFLFDELISDAQQAVERTASAQLQMRAAATLQRSLLPPRIPELDGFEIRRLYNSAADHTRVGGDWYDIVKIADHVTGFVVGDVAGHDIRSAAIMGQMRHVLASQLRDRGTPSGALAATDRYFADLAEDVMATAVVIVVDQAQAKTSLALAGHPPPVVIAQQGPQLVEAKPGPPMGFGYGGYKDLVVPFATGDTLIAYTDGVVENRNGDLSQLLDELVDALGSAGTNVDDLINILDRRSQLSTLVDDVAALVVQLVEP